MDLGEHGSNTTASELEVLSPSGPCEGLPSREQPTRPPAERAARCHELRAVNAIVPVYAQRNMALQLDREVSKMHHLQTVAYVFAAPDLNKSAGSVSELATVGHSLTLRE